MSTRRTACIIAVGTICFFHNLLGAAATISNIEPRRDTRGEIADAHDGCLEYFEGRFYLLFDNTCCFCTAGSGVRVYTANAALGRFAYRGNINVKAVTARDVPSPWTNPGSGRPDCVIKAQQTHVATLPTSSGTVYLWMGDRWGSRPDGVKGLEGNLNRATLPDLHSLVRREV